MAVKTFVTDQRAPSSFIGVAVTGILWVYKRTLSPVFYFFGARCRHHPTCSEYAAEAFRLHHPWNAFWLSLSRLLRCHPLGSHGIDPVPLSRDGAWWELWRLGDWSWREREIVEEEKP